MAYGSVLNQSFESSPVLGNYFTKEETISNATANLFGLSNNAVPDEAFVSIKNLINTLQSTVDNAPKIVTGSYVGTDTYGEGNPTTITFPFPIKIWGVIARIDNSLTSAVLNQLSNFLPSNVSGNVPIYVNQNTSVANMISYSSDMKTVYFYNSSSAISQNNSSGFNYYYFGIG